MLPQGGYSNTTSATSGADGGAAGGIGDKFTTVGGKVNTSLLSNTGISFGNKGIDPKWIIGGSIIIVYLIFRN